MKEITQWDYGPV